MKNILKLVGLFVLMGFSFFYTDKVVEVIREEDNIMIEIQSVKDLYKIDAMSANVVDNTIIPGVEGRVVNVDKSYKEMKSIGKFNKNSLVYDVVRPSVSIVNNKDKFIVKGNSLKQMVSLVFVINDDKYLNKINKISIDKDVIFNYFIDYEFLIDNTTLVKEMKNGEFYSYGNKGKYTPDNLLFSNNLISRIRNEEAIYCLNIDMDESGLDLCNSNGLYTISPSFVSGDNAYNVITKNLESGSIILIDITTDNINNLGVIIDYIKGKGLKIRGLSELINEEVISG